MLVERVALMGLSGSGKSTVGQVLAALLGWELVDTDAWIVAQVGRPIHEIFATEGEPCFRSWERRAVAAACAESSRVVALGGGAPLDPESFALLRATSVLVWLRAALETLVERLQTGAEVRPLLAGGALERLRTLSAEREATYRRADLVIEVDHLSARQVAERILAWLRAGGGRSPGARRPEEAAW